MADVQAFLDSMLDHDRQTLADRLEEASARLARLGPQIKRDRGDEASEWTPHEVLAHIAVLSKFYGVLVHRISSGQMNELDLLANVNLRDVAGHQMSELEPAELLGMALADHQRTAKLLRTAEPAWLRRAAVMPDGEAATAVDIARLPLINHLEMHVDQLEKTLGA